MKEENGKMTAHVIEALCKGCGVCGTACPTEAVALEYFTTRALRQQELSQTFPRE